MTTPIRVSREAVAARPGLIRVGTRGSALAVTQTTQVAERLAAVSGCEVVLVIVTTSGDISTAPLTQLGGNGVFVSALREALLRGDCDVAVHSLKDLPTAPCLGIVLGAVPKRVDPRDALCARDGRDLAALPKGALVGTGSPRRAAQILARRPDLRVTDLRGNVETRLGRIEADLDAVVLAVAGLERLGRADSITERFAPEVAPHAAGQGALAVELRETDALAAPGAPGRTLADALTQLDAPESRLTALAEQGVLAALGAGCAAPVGTWARCEGASRLVLSATVYQADGAAQVSAEAERHIDTGVGALSLPKLDVIARELGGEVAKMLLGQGAHHLAPAGTIGVTQ